MDWPTFFTHPSTVAVGAGVLAVLVGAFITYRFWRKQQDCTHRYWRKQQDYIDEKLLEDRRNERRHQAILEALRVMALVREDLLAKNLADSDFPDEYRIPQQKWCVAREALKKRLTKEEGEELHRLSTNPNDKCAYWDTRDYLITLLN
jgi:hypothetical protein